MSVFMRAEKCKHFQKILMFVNKKDHVELIHEQLEHILDNRAATSLFS